MSTNEPALLTAKQAAFLHALREPTSPTYNDATASYRATYAVKADASDASVAVQASKLMATPRVRAVLEQANASAVQAVVFDKVEVLRHLVEITTADPSKVSHVRRICCRHCHGVTHLWQWRDADEYWETVAATMQRNALREKNPKWNDVTDPLEPMPSDAGGYGWRRPNRPHPDCPKCFGEGEEDVYFADMSTLTGPERRLIASVKKTKDGLEVKMRDQDGALAKIADILGMIIRKGELSGPDGGPIPLAGVMAVLPVDANQAAQAYQRLMEGGK